MVIDSSALLAIIFEEDEALRLSSVIASARSRLISTVNLFESLIVIESRKGRPWVATATSLMERWAIHPIPFDGEHIFEAQAGLEALRQRPPSSGFEYGRLRGICDGSNCRRATLIQRQRFRPDGCGSRQLEMSFTRSAARLSGRFG